jgi:alkylhydroperoxidase family enzyme
MNRSTFPPVQPETATPEQLALLQRLPMAGIGQYLVHCPALAEPLIMVGAHLMSSESSHLPDDLREAVVLRTARVRNAPYIEHQHRRVAERVGVSAEVIDAAVEGSRAPGLPDAWRAPLALVEDSLAGRQAGQPDLDAVIAAHGHGGVMGLLVTAGFFSMIAMTIGALPMQLE